ncbi:C45 family autoproteolytic acyltransferase/hydolase [Pararhizobium mangrovi]|uniref:Peptidase C45 n=1 Tax=Pararhizobium mangrovi TaxID=2590452 RepID=A0A506TZB8_9HYPH|nr:C45 family peptidase [Pararhizobium mangrovi]TPW27432.1 peptidase C45 [Pararhizobium mangrovi]
MTRTYRSQETDPNARGRTFGSVHAEEIGRTVARYCGIFDTLAGGSYDIAADGDAALKATLGFAPHLHAEMLGLAEGTGLDPAEIGAINARTEILAKLRTARRGECSAAIVLPSKDMLDDDFPNGDLPPVAVQTWDWYWRLADNWLVWEIPLEDGTTTKTMTEFGIVGKVGLNTRGLGALFTILRHAADGARIGLPVHVAARAALDLGRDVADAARLLASADVSASSSINLVGYEAGTAAAISVELHPGGPSFVMPDANGRLVHTNHFLAPGPAAFDTEPRIAPDTLIRRDVIQRRIRADCTTPEAVLTAMNSHLGTTAAICCHHDPQDPLEEQFETIATVVLDVAAGTLHAHRGGPCSMPVGLSDVADEAEAISA